MGAGAAVDKGLTPGKYPVVDQLIHGMARITVGPSANAVGTEILLGSRCCNHGWVPEAPFWDMNGYDIGLSWFI